MASFFTQHSSVDERIFVLNFVLKLILSYVIAKRKLWQKKLIIFKNKNTKRKEGIIFSG